MIKTLTGIAAAAVIAIAAAPTTADAFAARHAPGVQEEQATVQQVWHNGVPHRRVYRERGYRAYNHGPYRAYRAYPYAAAPYPYYRERYYAPRPYVGVGPFGFGVW